MKSSRPGLKQGHYVRFGNGDFIGWFACALEHLNNVVKHLTTDWWYCLTSHPVAIDERLDTVANATRIISEGTAELIVGAPASLTTMLLP